MKRLALILMAVAALAFAASATAPPAHDTHAGGWGMNPTCWFEHSGGFSVAGLYDPLYTGGGAAWVVGWTGGPHYIVYAPITLELWVEMFALQTYQYTSYQWHRVDNLAEHLCFIIQGTIQSNNGQYISLTHGTEALDHLWFRENIFGGNTPTPAPNMLISWSGRWGTGCVYEQNQVWPGTGWNPIAPGQYGDPGDITVLIPVPCDHWWEFQGCFDIDYHQPDGYYSLTIAGCPAPVL